MQQNQFDQEDNITLQESKQSGINASVPSPTTMTDSKAQSTETFLGDPVSKMDRDIEKGGGGGGGGGRGEGRGRGRGSNADETERCHGRPSSVTLIEPSEEELERMGKARPEIFSNIFAEAGFVFAIVMSQILTEFFVSGFNVLLPTLVKAMDIPESVSVWPASAFSLVVGSTLLVFGRVADMTGGYPLYIGGLSWLVVWSIITGFSQNTNMLIICRAIQGFGPALYLPSGVMLLSNTYRPGKRKNIVFSIYATCGALGFFYGILMSGVAAQYINWRWYFWLGAISSGITLAAALLCVPSDVHESRQRGVKMDWLGSLFIVAGLVLVVFGLTESPHAPNGWRTPYVSVLFVVGWVLLAIAFYIEGWVAEHPLLPFDVFHVKYMKSFTIALWFFFGCSGVFLFYGVRFMQDEMGAQPMTVVAWFLPMLAGGIGFPCFLGLYMDRVSGTVLLLACNAAWIVLAVLFAVAKPEATYWQYIFPSMICATVGIDIVWDVSHIFITTNQASERQGLCGALINSILHVGIAVLLGMADIVNDQVSRHKSRLESYRAVFWFEFGCAVVSAVLMVFFVRIKPQKSELTVDEKRALEARRAQQQQMKRNEGHE